MAEREPESMAALQRARAAQARRNVFTLAALHAGELYPYLDGLPDAERLRLTVAYLDDLRGELKAQERNGRTNPALVEVFRAALEGHSVRAEVRGLPTERTP